MGFDAPTNVSVREMAVTRPLGTVLCPRCGKTNLATAGRCRSCQSALPSKAAPAPAPRAVASIGESRRLDLDTMFGELEALARSDEPVVQFQCPACGRFVDEVASRCACGARFEDPGILGYACPMCGTRVAADAAACRCGARFSD